MHLPEDIQFLAVEGVIGAGKTSLAGVLAQNLAGEPMLEVFEENPFLEKFYRDQAAYAFQTELFFLVSRHRQFIQAFEQRDLFRPLTVSDYTFDKNRIFANLNLDEAELGLYDTVSSALERDRVRPDFIVYLQASVETLLKRIRKRDRPMERGMDPDYLSRLVESYNHHFFHYSDCPVLIVNTDRIDFVENRSDLEELVKVVADCPVGTTFYSPMSLNS